MKYLLSISSLLYCASLFAQKPDNFFLTAEGNRTQQGFSFVYNRAWSKTNFGMGAGLEVIDIGQKKLGGLMPFFDVRYYLKSGRSMFIPLAQAGYNIYRYQFKDPNFNLNYSIKGGPGYAFGMGYSYRLKNGSGPFAGLRYTGIRSKITAPFSPSRYTYRSFKISLGWRF